MTPRCNREGAVETAGAERAPFVRAAAPTMLARLTPSCLWPRERGVCYCNYAAVACLVSKVGEGPHPHRIKFLRYQYSDESSNRRAPEYQTWQGPKEVRRAARKVYAYMRRSGRVFVHVRSKKKVRTGKQPRWSAGADTAQARAHGRWIGSRLAGE